MILWHNVLKVELDLRFISVSDLYLYSEIAIRIISFMLYLFKGIHVVLRIVVLQSGYGEKELFEKLVKKKNQLEI